MGVKMNRLRCWYIKRCSIATINIYPMVLRVSVVPCIHMSANGSTLTALSINPNDLVNLTEPGLDHAREQQQERLLGAALLSVSAPDQKNAERPQSMFYHARLLSTVRSRVSLTSVTPSRIKCTCPGSISTNYRSYTSLPRSIRDLPCQQAGQTITGKADQQSIRYRDITNVLVRPFQGRHERPAIAMDF